MISKEQLLRIKEFAIDLDWNSAFGGKSRGNQHLSRVVSIALRLAPFFEARLDIVEAGAWLHDTNLERTISGDTLANKDKVLEFLYNIGVSKEDSGRVLSCIASHDGRKEAVCDEAKVVHDADTLEKMGPLGVIRETWKRSQLGWTTEKIAEHLQKHLLRRKDNLYLDVARERADELHASLELFFKDLKVQLSVDLPF